MFDHMGIVVADLARSREFYNACMPPLGFELLEDHSSGDGGWLVYGSGRDDPFLVVTQDAPSFWGTRRPAELSPIHVGLQAPDARSVDGFYAAAMASGGTDNGPPGDRPSTTPYYAAYVLDPDGNNVEAGFRTR